MNRSHRKNSLASKLVVAILLCSIVCSVTNVYGAVGTPQGFKVVKEQINTTQVTSQVPEKVESETDSKHHCALFVIQTLINAVQSDLATAQCLARTQATRFDSYLNRVPRYLVEMTFRI